MTKKLKQHRRSLLAVLATASLIVLITSGLIWFFEPTKDSTTPTKQQLSKPVSVNNVDQLFIGDPFAPATIVEYADFKCPECAKYHQAAAVNIRNDYVDKGKVKIEFRPFPIFGPDAARALAGSYCANDQAKFRQYHDAMFDYMWQKYYKNGNYEATTQATLNDEVILSIVEKIGLDTKIFTSCLDSDANKERFFNRLAIAADDGVQGTPTFVIAGNKIVGPQPYSVFKTVIDLSLDSDRR